MVVSHDAARLHTTRSVSSHKYFVCVTLLLIQQHQRPTSMSLSTRRTAMFRQTRNDTETLACNPQGTLSYEELECLLHESRKVAPSSNDSDDIVTPATFDVLCGRDHESFFHEGNRRFRAIIAMNCERYQNAKSRDDKYLISDEIISEIGGYFLRKDPATNMWHDIGPHSAHEKVSHALRSAKAPSVPKKRVPRKKRTIAPRSATKGASSVYDTLLAEQQCIFRELLQADEIISSLRPPAFSSPPFQYQPVAEEDVVDNVRNDDPSRVGENTSATVTASPVKSYLNETTMEEGTIPIVDMVPKIEDVYDNEGDTTASMAPSEASQSWGETFTEDRVQQLKGTQNHHDVNNHQHKESVST